MQDTVVKQIVTFVKEHGLKGIYVKVGEINCRTGTYAYNRVKIFNNLQLDKTDATIADDY